MYGSYAHTEGEDDSVSATGSFSLASLAGSTKNYQRRMEQRSRSSGGSLPKVVRMGSTKKSLPTPVRMKSMETTGHSVSNFNNRLAAIEESEKSGQEQQPRENNVSMSDLFGSLALNTPSQTIKTMERIHCTSVTVTGNQDKISPDSGSFTMSSTKSRIIHDTREVDNFTDSLKNPMMAVGSSVTKTRPVTTRVAPVRTGGHMSHHSSQGPVRAKMTGARSMLTEDKARTVLDQDPIHLIDLTVSDKKPNNDHSNKENVPEPRSLLSSGVQPDQEPHRDVTARLQALAGNNQVSVKPTFETPRPSAAVPFNATPLPMRMPTQTHSQTPLPPRLQPPITPQQPSMPPPAPDTASKEKVLVVRGKSYRVMKVLGKGGSSRVYEALDYENNKVVAIKRVDLTDADDSQREGNPNNSGSLLFP